MFGPIEFVPILGVLLVMIPVAGFTFSMVIKTLAKVRREAIEPEQTGRVSAQIALLQEEVESLAAEVKELKSAQEFDRKLLAKRAAGGQGDG